MQKRENKESASNTGRLDVLYSNARVLRVVPYPASGALAVIITCDEREEQRILYEGVLYSQLDESAAGQRIAIAVILTPEEFCGGKHKSSAERFMRDCGVTGIEPVHEMARRGYRLFSHYIVDRDELIIIAKGLILS